MIRQNYKMITAYQMTEGDDPNGPDEFHTIEIRPEHKKEYEFALDDYSRLPKSLIIRSAEYIEYVEFTGSDMIGLIHGIVDNANKQTCKMLISLLTEQIEKLDNV